jgi:hypothetical protein
MSDLFHDVTISGVAAGDTWRLVLPLDGLAPAAGMSALMHVRRAVADAAIVLSFSTADGSILLEPDRIVLVKDSTATVPPGSYVWDIRITASGETDTPMGGQLIVRARVTR